MAWADYLPESDDIQSVFTTGIGTYVDAEIKKRAGVEDPAPKVESLPGETPTAMNATNATIAGDWRIWAGIAVAVVAAAVLLRG